VAIDTEEEEPIIRVPADSRTVKVRRLRGKE